jgi:hypothetical protein
MRFISVRPAGLLTAASLMLLASLNYYAQKDWRPVTAAEIQQAAPKVEADADAEAIFWEVRIDDSESDELSMRHYVRVKIFTERGREKYAKFDVPFTKGLKIKDLAARVTGKDGTVTEIKKEDIFEREIVKASGIKVKAKSFAVPNLEPGVIVEYRYREVIADSGAKGMRLAFQRDIPVQTLAYYYKPYNSRKPNYQSYNSVDAKFVKDKDGYYLAEKTDVPSFKEEPRMPPDDSVRPWMLLTGWSVSAITGTPWEQTIHIKDPSNMGAYWGTVASENVGYTNLMTKGSKDVKKLAAELTAGLSTPESKLARLYEYVQKEIRNTSFDPSLTDDDRKKLPKLKSLDDALEKKLAPSMYVDMLFGALANAAGFESRIALLGNRSEMFFEPQMTNDNLIHPGAVGVKVNGNWQYFNPGVPFLPAGSLLWYEEDTWALLVGEKGYEWKRTPLASHEKSNNKRTAKFKLLPDGTLEGKVKVEMAGHPAIAYRYDNWDEPETKRIDNYKESIKSRISAAEISNIAIENMNDASKPLVFSYDVKVPNYATKTGKRLFIQPGFFEFGSSPVFKGSTRKYDIFFRYPWSESDTVEIAWPEGYDLDNADAPGNAADNSKIGSLAVKMRADTANRVLHYDRKFHFGGNVLLEARMYTPLKGLFDEFHRIDSHTISLKQK